MKIFKMIDFIGKKNPNYKWENIVDNLPIKPIEGKGFLDNNFNKQGLWEQSEINILTIGFGIRVKEISKGLFKDDKKEGVWEKYFPDGELISKTQYKNGEKNGYWETYRKDGNLDGKGSYKNGKMNGISEHYWDNGNLKEKGNYVNGEKDGYWEFYNQDGSLHSKRLWDNGKLLGFR